MRIRLRIVGREERQARPSNWYIVTKKGHDISDTRAAVLECTSDSEYGKLEWEPVEIVES